MLQFILHMVVSYLIELRKLDKNFDFSLLFISCHFYTSNKNSIIVIQSSPSTAERPSYFTTTNYVAYIQRFPVTLTRPSVHLVGGRIVRVSLDLGSWTKPPQSFGMICITDPRTFDLRPFLKSHYGMK